MTNVGVNPSPIFTSRNIGFYSHIHSLLPFVQRRYEKDPHCVLKVRNIYMKADFLLHIRHITYKGFHLNYDVRFRFMFVYQKF
jgi:hypothetical protein